MPTPTTISPTYTTLGSRPPLIDTSPREGELNPENSREEIKNYYLRSSGNHIDHKSREGSSSSPATSLFIFNDRQLSRNMQNKQLTGTLYCRIPLPIQVNRYSAKMQSIICSNIPLQSGTQIGLQSPNNRYPTTPIGQTETILSQIKLRYIQEIE